MSGDALAFWPTPVYFAPRPNYAPALPAVWGGLAPQPAMPPERTVRYGKRQNISDACAGCRRSKVKCDEQKPCRRCLRDGRQVECVSWRTVGVPSSAAAALQTGANAPAPATKRRRTAPAKKDGADVGIVLPPAGVREKVCPLWESRDVSGDAQWEQVQEQLQELRQASAILLSFAGACSKAGGKEEEKVRKESRT
jgi:hypothetical protein